MAWAAANSPRLPPHLVPGWHNGWVVPAELERSTPASRTGWGLDSHRKEDERQRPPASLFSSLGMPPPLSQERQSMANYSPRWQPTASPGFAQHLLPKRPGHIAVRLGYKTGRPILPEEKNNPMWSPRQLTPYHPSCIDPIHGVKAKDVKKSDPVMWQTTNERAFANTFALNQQK